MDQALAKLKLDNDAVILYKEKLHEIIVKIVKLIEDKILVHPLVEKIHGIARNIILDAYRKCLPYLAKISENSLLAGGISFGLGVILSYWIFSIYFVVILQSCGIARICFRPLLFSELGIYQT